MPASCAVDAQSTSSTAQPNAAPDIASVARSQTSTGDLDPFGDVGIRQPLLLRKHFLFQLGGLGRAILIDQRLDETFAIRLRLSGCGCTLHFFDRNFGSGDCDSGIRSGIRGGICCCVCCAGPGPRPAGCPPEAGGACLIAGA